MIIRDDHYTVMVKVADYVLRARQLATVAKPYCRPFELMFRNLEDYKGMLMAEIEILLFFKWRE